MKKICFLLIFGLFLSGCTVEYDVNITSDNATELTTINGLINENYPVTAYIDDQGASETNEKLPELEYYDITQTSNAVSYKFIFPFERYLQSTGVNYCYKDVNVIRMDQNSYRLVTNNFNSCLDFYNDLEQIRVNLHFNEDFDITDHNADQTQNNTYTWIINRNNYNNKNIEIMYSFKNVNNNQNENKKNSKLNPLIILCCFGILIIVLALVIRSKNKNWKDAK